MLSRISFHVLIRQGAFHVLDDADGVAVVGLERVSFVPTDVVVALSVGEKGGGSLLSSAAGERRVILSHATRLKPNGFPSRTCSIAGQAFVVGFVPSALLFAFPFLRLLVSFIDGLILIPIDTSWLRNFGFIVSNPVSTFAFKFKIFGRCVIRNLWNGAVASNISSLYFLSSSVAGVWFPST
uniref:Uncharacterized protein n=1 Tax=Tanacetum cinerariifolium TaxID=118510 RepID=A0A6L2L165_TANCI|nr:hypothetical protein [Tanacetum cinerariifolium]